jgi:hypothetical protein
VTVEASIANRRRMEGDGVERTVVVTRFVGARPGKRCATVQPR